MCVPLFTPSLRLLIAAVAAGTSSGLLLVKPIYLDGIHQVEATRLKLATRSRMVSAGVAEDEEQLPLSPFAKLNDDMVSQIIAMTDEAERARTMRQLREVS